LKRISNGRCSTVYRTFLLELGRGFAFVGRQKHRLSTETKRKDFYVDLVFYNFLLKCFVLLRSPRAGD